MYSRPAKNEKRYPTKKQSFSRKIPDKEQSFSEKKTAFLLGISLYFRPFVVRYGFSSMPESGSPSSGYLFALQFAEISVLAADTSLLILGPCGELNPQPSGFEGGATLILLLIVLSLRHSPSIR